MRQRVGGHQRDGIGRRHRTEQDHRLRHLGECRRELAFGAVAAEIAVAVGEMTWSRRGPRNCW
jgi:hypothetical protein